MRRGKPSALAALALAGGLAAVTAGLTPGTEQGAAVAAQSYVSAVIAPGGPITHVVIMYQENHTFDDVLGAVCQARTNPCNGYTDPVTLHNGTVAQNVVEPDLVPNSAHDPHSQRLGLAGKWNKILGCHDAPYYCVSHVDPANIPNLATYADTYSVSDATFAAGQAASFVAHVSLGAGTFDRFAGWNPAPGLWGCEAHDDALWGRRTHLTLQPSCVPDQQGRGPYRESKVAYVPTIMQRMEEAGLSWHIYEGRKKLDQPELSNFSICPYFYWCYNKRYKLQYDSSDQEFVHRAGNGSLPNLSILIPDFNVSQHNTTSMGKGDNYIGDMVSAVMNGPDWDSTAIFITYDDCGCFYDHVTPPSHRMGMRNPMVIISPWAKPQGTDSTPAIQPYSMLAFTEHVFGLAPLSKEVDTSYDYANSFDFGQKPLAGVPAVHQRIPKAELEEIAKLRPSVIDDPT